MKTITTALLSIILFSSCSAASTPASSRPSQADFVRCEVNESEQLRLMSLPLQEFDEYSDDGWTTIASRKGCNHVAAQIILDYIEHNKNRENYGQFFYILMPGSYTLFQETTTLQNCTCRKATQN